MPGQSEKKRKAFNVGDCKGLNEGAILKEWSTWQWLFSRYGWVGFGQTEEKRSCSRWAQGQEQKQEVAVTIVWWESGEINMLGLREGGRSKLRYMQRMGIEESSLFVL